MFEKRSCNMPISQKQTMCAENLHGHLHGESKSNNSIFFSRDHFLYFLSAFAKDILVVHFMQNAAITLKGMVTGTPHTCMCA